MASTAESRRAEADGAPTRIRLRRPLHARLFSRGRRRREFGTAVLHLAAAARRRTAVIGAHWDEPATTDEAPHA